MPPPDPSGMDQNVLRARALKRLHRIIRENAGVIDDALILTNLEHVAAEIQGALADLKALA